MFNNFLNWLHENVQVWKTALYLIQDKLPQRNKHNNRVFNCIYFTDKSIGL